MNDAEKRLALLEQMIAKGSTDPFHHYARAMELRALDRAADALQAYEEVAQRFPEYVPTYLMGAQLAKELGRPERARELLQIGMAAAEAQGNDHALSEMSTLLGTL